MTRVLIVGAVIAAFFWIVSIVDCAVQPPTRHRGVSKGAWVLIVVFLPVIGGILWFAFGRRPKSAPRAPIAPDDNPEFLSSIGSISDQNERIRRLEEELARLDAEDADPDSGPTPPTAGDQDDNDDSSSRGPQGAAS